MKLNKNKKLYIVIVVFLIFVCAVYIYSRIEMKERTKNWTESDWDKYYEENVKNSNFDEEYQCVHGSCQGE
ncbi:MAG: hypothetical protein V1804_00545 [Patescibacteria group bacterium]